MINRIGKVYLVGAGPGDPDLLTLKAVKCLNDADIVLYDYLVSEEALKYTRSGTVLVPLGHPHEKRNKEQPNIHRIMIGAASEGKIAVHLKGGDPHLFGRLGEETLALRQAKIPFEVIPGVTAAAAAAQIAGISLTEKSNGVAFITGHLAQEKVTADYDYGCWALFPGTLVFYMGIATVEHWSRALMKGGRAGNSPVWIVRKATFADQKLIRTTLDCLVCTVEQEKIESPCIVIIGSGQTTSNHSNFENHSFSVSLN